jgi:hypothetical protein
MLKSAKIVQMARAVILGATVGVVATPAVAQMTPTDVYKVVDGINHSLERLHAANLSDAKVSVPDNIRQRRPRHVLQKAREVFEKTQLLRRINGLPTNAVPTLEVREVRPADVMKMVRRVQNEVEELEPVFGLAADAKTADGDGAEKKTPTDVYRHLSRASKRLDGLGIPAMVPNDVYRVAKGLYGDIAAICSQIDINTVSIATVNRQLAPKDVYNAGYKALARLRDHTRSADAMSVPGGITLPNKPTGKITPSHVLSLLNTMLADVGAIKAKLGVTSPTNFPAGIAGKTPREVFAVVDANRKMVEALEDRSAG